MGLVVDIYSLRNDATQSNFTSFDMVFSEIILQETAQKSNCWRRTWVMTPLPKLIRAGQLRPPTADTDGDVGSQRGLTAALLTLAIHGANAKSVPKEATSQILLASECQPCTSLP